jgi:hypothetical protein
MYPPGRQVLRLEVEPGGYGGVLATSSASEDLARFLRSMSAMTKRELASYDGKWRVLQQKMVPIPPTPKDQRPAAEKSGAPPSMAFVPEHRKFDFVTRGLIIEGDELGEGVDVQSRSRLLSISRRGCTYACTYDGGHFSR